MARRKIRVNGPYKHRGKWRLIVINEGRQTPFSYETEEEAIKERDILRREIHVEETEFPIAEALTEYQAHMVKKGNKERTIRTTMGRLRSVLSDAHVVRELTPARFKRMYEDYCGRPTKRTKKPPAVDTQRNTLGQVKTFFRWLVDKNHMRRNPAAKVEGMGRRQRGKPQLRNEEAREFMQACLDEDSIESLAALVALILGLRASEVVNIAARDIDDGGAVLWIPDSKTKAGRRTLQVPPVLGDLLMTQRKRVGRRTRSKIFPGDRHWVRRNVVRLAKVAKVPRVTPHGLRGTHSSLTAEQGVTGHVVAKSLGHASYAVTEAHYVDKGAAQRGKQGAVMAKLTAKPKARKPAGEDDDE